MSTSRCRSYDDVSLKKNQQYELVTIKSIRRQTNDDDGVRIGVRTVLGDESSASRGKVRARKHLVRRLGALLRLKRQNEKTVLVNFEI